MKSYIIVANGPFLAPEIIKEAIQSRRIVALDGAADKLLLLGIKPDVILGDFDSIHPQTQAYWGINQCFETLPEHAVPYKGHHNVLIVPAKDQSQTDLVKAIRYCDQAQAEDISIICATGGREDQHEASKWALQTEYRAHRPILIHSEQQTLRWAENETVTLQGEIGDYCGFVAQTPGSGHSEGLAYACDHIPISLCNQLQTNTAKITIEGKALLMMPPQFAAQRQLIQTNKTRLSTQLIDAL
ncbi:MAG: thiamine diphosphokinase [Gammaproteobacteria bacterium]|nr:thiamine diphosphokinase [Gammaproteobacteria bacterium]